MRPEGAACRLEGQHTLGGYMTRYTLHIEGMSCGHCLNAVNQALAGVAGTTVESVRMGRALVRAEGETGEDALVAAVEDAGYSVALVEPTP